MPIRRLSVRNFKSFRELEIAPGPFTVVIGSNASGKSNLIQVIKFLRDIAKYGLENAVSLQGGIEYLRNTQIGASEPFSLRIEYALEEQPQRVVPLPSGTPLLFSPREVAYSFSLAFPRGGEAYEVASDTLAVTGDFALPGGGTAGEGRICIFREGGTVRYRIVPPAHHSLRAEDLAPLSLHVADGDAGRLVATIPPLLPGVPSLEWIFRGMKVYDFDPRLLKRAVPIMGKTDLEKDGSNLAIVIKKILDDPARRALFSRLLSDLLPFVDDISVEKFMDMSMFLKVREVYNREKYIPASLVSDGTINICAILIALYFEGRPVTIIEEPERNIHPSLIGRLVEMCRDASAGKQVIVTTHNPEMLRHVGVEEILLVARGADGFSRVGRPADREEVREFLAHEIGIDDLFVQNLLDLG
ncbi:MAG: AAA family ATPase [Methanolinea sp.]|nr:AAA family ATPase [Methanolinea sp.]